MHNNRKYCTKIKNLYKKYIRTKFRKSNLELQKCIFEASSLQYFLGKNQQIPARIRTFRTRGDVLYFRHTVKQLPFENRRSAFFSKSWIHPCTDTYEQPPSSPRALKTDTTASVLVSPERHLRISHREYWADGKN